MLTEDTAQRKATPIWSGVLRYFPDALAAVARLSKAGNDKHNPGEPLHWAREKSTDHGDCIIRHQMAPEAVDPETGEFHAASVAWRALAQLQLLEEGKRLTDLVGPMGKAEKRPVPGVNWERGTGRMPAWARGQRVQYRYLNEIRGPYPSQSLGWYEDVYYRLAQ